MFPLAAGPSSTHTRVPSSGHREGGREHPVSNPRAGMSWHSLLMPASRWRAGAANGRAYASQPVSAMIRWVFMVALVFFRWQTHTHRHSGTVRRVMQCCAGAGCGGWWLVTGVARATAQERNCMLPGVITMPPVGKSRPGSTVACGLGFPFHLPFCGKGAGQSPQSRVSKRLFTRSISTGLGGGLGVPGPACVA